MSFCFATCDRVTALHFLQILYPNHIITDEENSAKKILDWVEKDIVRIPDPKMHGIRVEVLPSANFKEEYRDKIFNDCKKFHENPGRMKITRNQNND